MSVSAAATIQQMLSKSGCGYYIANTYITNLSSTSFTAGAMFFMSIADSTNSFLGWGVWRPTATAAGDYFRHVASVNITSGVVTIDVAWATDTDKTSEDIYLLKPGITPLHIINALNYALDKAYFINTDALSSKPAGTLIADASFQGSATSSYTASNTTFTKVSTDNSENVFDAIGSGRAANSGAGGYIYQRFNVTELEAVNVFALSRLDSGTNAELVLRDASNSVNIGTTVEHDQEAWQWMVRRGEQIPSGCKLFDVRLQGEGASDDIYWNALNVLFPNQSRVYLDTKWDSNFKAMKLLYYDLGGVSSGTGIYQAMASQVREVPKSDYRFVFQRTAANPGYVQFHNNSQRHWMGYPLFVYGRRPYSALTTVLLSDITLASDIPLNLWDGLARAALFDMGDVMRKVPDAGIEMAKGLKAAQDAASMTAEDTEAPAARVFARWGGLRN